jgi:protocatechuate 3,4-dioxygenase beta subunit
MRFISRALFLVLLIGTILSAAALAQTAQKQATGVITGRVTHGDKAAANVSVVLVPAEVRMGPVRETVTRAVTDYEGRYRLSNVPAGRYNVVAVSPSFVGPNEGLYGESGKTVTIAEGETVEKIDFALVRGGVITGRVTDAEGQPVVGERIQINQQPSQGRGGRGFSNSNPFMYETDDRGVYRIYGIPPGRYTVSLGSSGESGSIRFGFGGRGYYTRTFHPGVTEEAKATVIELGEGTEATAVDIVLGAKSKSFTAAGRVLDENGKAVAGARIGNSSLMKDNRMGGFGYGAVSDSNGGFRLDGLLPGRYAAFVWNDGEIEGYSEPVTFEITEGNISGLELKMRRGASISGVAVLEGATDKAAFARLQQLILSANVEAEGVAAPSFSNARIAPDGSFRLTGLRPGKARIHLGGFPTTSGFTLARVEREGVAVREIEIAPGAQVTGVRVVIEYGSGSVRGLVKTEGGSIPEGARMFVMVRRRGEANAPPANRGGQVDSRGRFLIEGLATGEYELTLQAIIPGTPRRIAPVKQIVTITNGVESEVTFNLDLNAKDAEGGPQ